jgi:hypothetical protein
LFTCTTHSGDKKTHDWAVGQLADLFRTTHTVKNQQVVRNLHYPNPNDIDKSLNDTTADKIRKYRADYNNNPPNSRLCRLLLVLQADYIVNLLDFYSYRLIGKLTAFLQLQAEVKMWKYSCQDSCFTY